MFTVDTNTSKRNWITAGNQSDWGYCSNISALIFSGNRLTGYCGGHVLRPASSEERTSSLPNNFFRESGSYAWIVLPHVQIHRVHQGGSSILGNDWLRGTQNKNANSHSLRITDGVSYEIPILVLPRWISRKKMSRSMRLIYPRA